MMKKLLFIFMTSYITLWVGRNPSFSEELGKTHPRSSQSQALEEGEEYESETDYLKEEYRGRRWIEIDEHAIRHHGPAGEIERETHGDFGGVSGPETVHLKLFKDRGHVLVERTKFQESETFSSSWEIYAADGSTVVVKSKYSGEMWPSPDGTYLVGLGYGGYYNDGHLRLFNLDGTLRKDVKVFDWGGNQSRVAISNDGNFGVLLQSGEKFIPERGRIASPDEYGALAIFDRDGNILGKHEQPNWQPVGPGDSEGVPHVRVLSNSRKIILEEGNANSNMTCFDLKANWLWSSPTRPSLAPCGTELSVSKDEKKILVITTCEKTSQLKVLNLESGKADVSRDLEIAAGPVINLPSRPISKSEWAKFQLRSLGDRAVLVYSRAKGGRGDERKNGLWVFDFKGEVVQKADLDAPADSIMVEGEELLIRQGGKVRKWGPRKR